MRRRGVAYWTPNATIRRIGAKVKENKVETMGIIIKRVTMFYMETKTAIKTSIGIIIITKTIRVGPMFHLKIGKLLQGMVEVVWRELRICCRRWWGGLMLVMSMPKSWELIYPISGKRWMHILNQASWVANDPIVSYCEPMPTGYCYYKYSQKS